MKDIECFSSTVLERTLDTDATFISGGLKYMFDAVTGQLGPKRQTSQWTSVPSTREFISSTLIPNYQNAKSRAKDASHGVPVRQLEK